MRRRTFLTALAVVPAAPAFAGRVASLDDALRWLETLERAPGARTTAGWPIGTVLHHLAQSIEMSLDGFPEPRSALFQSTVGSAAFAVFRFRGRMSHGLTDPIPGAPALPQEAAVAAGAAHLRSAIGRFQQHGGALRPHFAYGALDRADYALAHAMHIANHQDEIVTG